MVIGLQGAMPGEVQSILLALLGFYLSSGQAMLLFIAE